MSCAVLGGLVAGWNLQLHHDAAVLLVAVGEALRAVDELVLALDVFPPEAAALDGLPIPSLMRLARCDWTALVWLCWSAGLDHVALPVELRPPAAFGQAAGMSVERAWRCRDQLTTAGLRSMSQGIGGFAWEGIEIGTMPAVLAEIAAAEYLEMRALFYWLCDAGVQSPWQDNLRAPD